MARKGYENYDPNGVGVANGNFLGLPRVEDAAVDFRAIPFAPTVSYGTGTAGGPANVLAASYQLDVCLPGLDRPWELGFDWYEIDAPQIAQQPALRTIAERHIARLENGSAADGGTDLAAVNEAGEQLAIWIYGEVSGSLAAGRFPVLIGGSHATALGAYWALPEDCGILQIDAHMDLREAYEGFAYSHASVMYNMLRTTARSTRPSLVQVGIRDYCPAEQQLARESERVTTFYDVDLQRAKLSGEAFAKTCGPIIAALPNRTWISLDIDGLDPSLCPNTGTPVPGGLSFAEALYLCRAVIESGREVIGMDIVEVAGAPHEYEGAVAARLGYEVSARAVTAKRQ